MTARQAERFGMSRLPRCLTSSAPSLVVPKEEARFTTGLQGVHSTSIARDAALPINFDSRN
jgi:hypothetical protein